MATIYLFNGEHFLLNRQPSSLDVYINTQYKSDHKPLNVDLTIQPLTCDKVTSAYTTTYGTSICVTDSTYLTEANALSGTALVTLINKRREKFRLDIANKLVIKNVTIDSLDSVLMSKDGLTDDTEANTCLKTRERCCGTFSESTDATTGVVTTTLSNYDTSVTTYSCNDAFTDLKASFEFDCYANWPDRAMFEMRVNNPTLFEVRHPNAFEFTNSSVINTFY